MKRSFGTNVYYIEYATHESSLRDGLWVKIFSQLNDF